MSWSCSRYIFREVRSHSARLGWGQTLELMGPVERLLARLWVGSQRVATTRHRRRVSSCLIAVVFTGGTYSKSAQTIMIQTEEIWPILRDRAAE